MPEKPGVRVAAVVKEVGKMAGFHSHHQQTGTAHVYEIRARACEVRVVIDPDVWLSLSCNFITDPNRESVYYEIDTDLYDLTSSKFQSLARETEADIVTFLEAIGTGRIYARSVRRRDEVVFPVVGGFVKLRKGRWLTSSKTYIDLKDAMNGTGWKAI